MSSLSELLDMVCKDAGNKEAHKIALSSPDVTLHLGLVGSNTPCYCFSIVDNDGSEIISRVEDGNLEDFEENLIREFYKLFNCDDFDEDSDFDVAFYEASENLAEEDEDDDPEWTDEKIRGFLVYELQQILDD